MVPLASSRRSAIALRPERSSRHLRPPLEAPALKTVYHGELLGVSPVSLSPLSRSPHDLGPSSHGPRVTALLEGPLLSRVPARRISTREIGGRSHGMACKVVARKHTHGVGGRHCTHASQARTLTSRDLARPKTRSRDPLRLERPALAPASRPIAYKV